MRVLCVFFLLIVCSVQIAYSEHSYDDIYWGGDEGVEKSSNSTSYIPGPSIFYRETGHFRRRKSANYSEYYFPLKEQSQKMKCLSASSSDSNISVLESECKKNPYITLYYPSFEGVVSGNSNLFGHSVPVKDVWLHVDLEWKVENSLYNNRWHSASSHVTSVEALSSHLKRDRYQLNHRYSFPKRNTQLNLSSLLDEIFKNSDSKKYYDRNGKLNIRFRFVYHVEVQRKKRKGNVSGYFCPESSCELNVCVRKSEVGVLQVDESVVPHLNNDRTMPYAIIEGQSSLVPFVSEGLDKDESLSDGYEIYVDGIKKKFIESKGKNTLDLSSFCKSENIMPGSHLTVRRVVGETVVSNPVEFVYLSLPRLYEKEVGYSRIEVCSSMKEDSIFKYLTAREAFENSPSSFFKLTGADCDFGVFDSVRETYGVKYVWRYRYGATFDSPSDLIVSNGNSSFLYSWEVSGYDFDGDGKSIYVPKSMLIAGRVVYFEKVAILQNYGNMEIQTSDLNGEPFRVMVNTYRPMKLDLFSFSMEPKQCCLGESASCVMSVSPNSSYTKSKYGKVFYTGSYGDLNWSSENGLEVECLIPSVDSANIFEVKIDGVCGQSIIFRDSITPVYVDHLNPSDVISTKENIHVSRSFDEVLGDSVVVFQGIKGTPVGLGVKGTAPSDCDFYVSRYPDGKNWKSISSFSDSFHDEILYLFCKGKRDLKCTSSPLTIILRELTSELNGGRFSSDTIWACPDSPLTSLPELSDPSMEDATRFTYEWNYSTSGNKWYPLEILDESNRPTVMNSKGFQTPSDFHVVDGMLIRRSVSAWKDDVVLAKGYSNELHLKTYKKNIVEILVNDREDNVLSCHGDSISIAAFAYEAYGYPTRGTSLGLDEYAILEVENRSDYSIDTICNFVQWRQKSNYKWNKEGGNYFVRMKVGFCGNTVSSNSVDVSTPETPALNVRVDPCKVVGQSVNVNVSTGEYGFDCYVVTDTIRQQYRASVFIPEKKDVAYQVFVEDSKGCTYWFDTVIPADDIEERIVPSPIEFRDSMQGTSFCASEPVVLINRDPDSLFYHNSWILYSWGENDRMYLTGSFDRDSFLVDRREGSYLVLRSSDYYKDGKYCYSVEDSVFLKSWPEVKAPSVDLENHLLCYGEETNVVVRGFDGGTSSAYRMRLKVNSDTLDFPGYVHVGDSLVVHIDSLHTGKNFVTAMVTDSICHGYSYQKISSTKVVNMTENLTFDYSVDRLFFLASDFDEEGNTILRLDCNVKNYRDTFELRMNSKQWINTTGFFKVTVNQSDFDADGRLPLSVKRIAQNTNSMCVYRRDTTVYIASGFNKEPIISCGNYISGDTIVCCPNDTLSFSIEDGLLFNDQPVPSFPNYQACWYLGNSIVGSGSTCEVRVGPYEKNICVVISFKDSIGFPRKIMSRSMTVSPIGADVLGRVSFLDSDLLSLQYCVNSRDTISMVADYDGELTWQMYRDDGGDWIDVPDSICANGIAAHGKSINVLAGTIENKRTFFRVKNINACGIVGYGENILQVTFKRSIPLSGKVMSETLFDNRDLIPDTLLVNLSSKSGDTCFLFDSKGKELSAIRDDNGRYRVRLDSMDFGLTSISAVRGEFLTSGELCLSDPARIDYRVYETIKKPVLKSTYQGEWLCNGDSLKMSFSVDSIYGGTGRYECVWSIVPSYVDSEFYLPSKTDDGRSFYDAWFQMKMEGDSVAENRTLQISNVTQSMTLIARVYDKDDKYPGGNVICGETSINVFPRFKSNGIPGLGRELCYGTQLDTIKANAASGSTQLQYTWYCRGAFSKDDYEIMEGSVDENGSFVFPNSVRMEKSMQYKRVVEDMLCHQSDSTEGYLDVWDNLNLSENDISYSKSVLTGNPAVFYATYPSWTGQNDPRRMVWMDENKNEVAKSRCGVGVYSDTLIVPEENDSMTVRFYARCTYGACQSEEDLPFEVNVYNSKKGVLSIENEQISNKKPYWICSGEKIGNIVSRGGTPDVKYRWYYQASKHNSNELCGESRIKVTSAGVDLDTTSTSYSLTNESGEKGFLDLIRFSSVTKGDEYLPFENDTIRVWIVPSLSSVEEKLLGRSGNLAGEFVVKDDKTEYCINEPVNLVTGVLPEELMGVWENYRSDMGPSIYDSKGEYGLLSYIEETYRENGSSVVVRYDSCDINSSHYAGENAFIPHGGNPLPSTLSVVRVVSDGCSSVSSRPLVLRLGVTPINEDSRIFIQGYEENETNYVYANSFSDGFEVGDQLTFIGRHSYATVFFKDEACTDTIKDRIILEYTDEEKAELPIVFCKAYNSKIDCYSESSIVTIPFGLKSDGGVISVGDSVKLFANDSFPEIVSLRDAHGTYIAPERRDMEWTYSWQYCYSDKLSSWRTLEDVTSSSSSLPKKLVNSIAVPSVVGTPYVYVRRVATNEKGRSRYSNVLKLRCLEQSIAHVGFDETFDFVVEEVLPAGK